MRIIRRYRPLSGLPFPEGPYIADIRSFDVPKTIGAMIRNAPPNCVAVTLRPYGGAQMIVTAEREARRKGLRIIWVPARRALRSLTGDHQKTS